VKHGSSGVPAWHIAQVKLRKENAMKKYLIAAAFILCAPQTLLAQAEMFYVVLDHTTNQCTVMTNEPTTQKTRYKTLGKYATQDEAKAALDSMIGSACPKL
jgi:hypothetical protein